MRIDKDQRADQKATQVSRQQAFESRLTALAQKADPVAGFFGPGSHSWRISREAVLFSTGMAPLLLQLAHPKVAQAVADYSKYREEPLGRAYRTFDAVFKIVFGTRDTALQVARRVYAVHGVIQGKLQDEVPCMHPDYVAADPELLLWVYATLVESSSQGYQLFVRSSPESEKAEAYEETKVFAQLFGVPPDVLPVDYRAFRAYYDAMIYGNQLIVTPTARQVANALMFARATSVGGMGRVVNAVGAYLMPERLRRGFEMPWTLGDQVMARGVVASLRRTVPRLPPDLRAAPAARMAERRVAGTGAGFLARGIDRAMVRLAHQTAQVLG